MDNNVFLIVLFASVMHAVWNGMVKNHSDKAIAISGIVFGRLPLSLIAIIEAANSAAFIAPSSPIATVPTGIPLGI